MTLCPRTHSLNTVCSIHYCATQVNIEQGGAVVSIRAASAAGGADAVADPRRRGGAVRRCGYARTTLAKIAAAAGVSAETVQGQGPKAALLIAAVEYAAFGVAGEENVFNLDVGRTTPGHREYEEAVDFLVAAADGYTQTDRATGPCAFRGRQRRSRAGAVSRGPVASINLQTRRILDSFRDRGWLRDDVPFDDLVETAAVLCSVETYLRITHRDGWSVDAYRAWCRRVLTETVFFSPQST